MALWLLPLPPLLLFLLAAAHALQESGIFVEGSVEDDREVRLQIGVFHEAPSEGVLQAVCSAVNEATAGTMAMAARLKGVGEKGSVCEYDVPLHILSRALDGLPLVEGGGGNGERRENRRNAGDAYLESIGAKVGHSCGSIRHEQHGVSHALPKARGWARQTPPKSLWRRLVDWLRSFFARRTA